MKYPMLSVQDGFIQASGLTSTNTMPAAWEIRGDFTVDEILAAVRLVVAGHESLRTSIVTEPNGSHRQLVTSVDDVALRLDVLDLRRDGDSEASLSWLMGQHLADPFDLTSPPLWRGFLADVGDKRWVLGLAFAHVIVDGTSVMVFARDLGHALETSSPPDPLQLGTIALAEREIHATAEQATWWADQYAQRTELRATWGGDRAHFRVHPVPRFAPDAVEGLKRLAANRGASISTVFGALAAVTAAVVLNCRPMLGFTTSQRNPGNQSTFGPVHDHLPVFGGTDDGMSFADFVLALHARRDGARERRLPSRSLAAIARSTPYDVAVNYSPFAAPTPHAVGRRGVVMARPIPTIGKVDVYRATSVAPVVAAILRPDERGGVTGDVTAISTVLTAVRVRDIALTLAAVTKDVLANPETPIRDLMERA